MKLRNGTKTGTKVKSKGNQSKVTKKVANDKSKAKRSTDRKGKSSVREVTRALSRGDLDAITQKNASSPLLRLPQEIKDLIYNFVIEGLTLHMYDALYWNRKVSRIGYTNFVCYAHEPEVKAARMAQKPLWLEHEHSHCYDPNFVSYHRPIRYATLSLLFTCRQAYKEIHIISFSKHTYSFGLAYTLQGWIETLAPFQLTALECIHLELYRRGTYGSLVSEWEAAIESTLGRVRGLKSIELDLYETEDIANQEEIPEDILRLGRLPLGSATMVMRYGPGQVASFSATQGDRGSERGRAASMS